MIALSSDDYMGAWRYKLADDETLKVYHLPIKYNFDPIYKDFNLYVNSTISRAEIEDPFGYKVSLNMFKLGFGLRYKPQLKYRSKFEYEFLNNYCIIN
jgi:hypothetical protein